MSEPQPKITSHAKTHFTNIGLAQLGGYRFAVSSVVSILHRVSGALLFLVGIPVLLYLLQQSLGSEQGFAQTASLLSSGWAKVGLLILAWAFVHHFLAGIRFLLLDLHMGIELRQAQRSSRAVLVGSLLLTVIIGLKLFRIL